MSREFLSIIESTDLDQLYRNRRNKVYDYMRDNEISAAVFIDNEDCRDVTVRYLTGHPSDAVLVLSAEGQCWLSPWDINLADKKAHAENIIPFTDFDRSEFAAVSAILKKSNPLSAVPSVEFPKTTTLLNFNRFTEELKGYNATVKEGSVHDYVVELRACKDEYEIACTREACYITDEMTVAIIQAVTNGTFKTESDIALYAEKHLRERGCECTSFDTLAAGPERSFAIHAFPGYTGASWGQNGLSLLDYGVCYNGYASDCTITVARGNLNEKQKTLLSLVQKAKDECLPLYAPGKPLKDPGILAEKIFNEKGFSMPHSLGHGTGLQIHEAPFIRTKADEKQVFKPGNIVTLEPGLYDPLLGGSRLENDVLITETGNLVLTNSKIFYL